MSPRNDNILTEIFSERFAVGRDLVQDRLELLEEAFLEEVAGAKFVEDLGEDVGVLVLGAARV